MLPWQHYRQLPEYERASGDRDLATIQVIKELQL